MTGPASASRSKKAPAPASSSSSFLKEMVATVEEELHAGLYSTRPASVDVPIGHRTPWKEALRASPSRPALIVELKHASPGRQESRLAALPPERFARLCEEAGASALSVIPQPYAFGGSLEEFAKVARATRLPLLFKDFVIDVAQIEAARTHGASAVLLLARLARSGDLHRPLVELVSEAHQRGLETLVEVHAASEVRMALESGTDALGVNARDLGTLHLDLRTALPVLRTLRKDPRPLVAMSGVEGPREVARYATTGADAVLVGTAFARSSDPLGFLRSLRAPRSSPDAAARPAAERPQP